MVQKQAKKEAKLLPAVMKEYDAVFSLSLSEGFANICFDEKGNIFVKFLNDEGYATEDAEQNLADVQKVARFMEEMKTLRLQDYSRPNA